VPDHAAVDLSVRLTRADRRAARYAGLVNAVLRRIAQQGAARLHDADTTALDTPPWLLKRWTQAYGADMAHAIAQANSREAALDLSVKQDPERWADALGGRVLPTGTVRAIAHGPVAQLPGFADGAWWVQDAAAALPARLLGDVRGKTVADLCAAPGGKTAQLAQAGAHVVAVDRTDARLTRLRQNLARLKLAAETVVADATQWQAGPFDAVLLDAPCSSTGTIRRHPDIPWLKREGDIAELTTLQHSLLARAVELVKPGGLLVYCTCSLEPEECETIVADLLTRDSRLRRRPATAAEVSGCGEFLTANGDLRTLPCHLPDAVAQLGGMDGFYAARLERL
jgi:16S rRNA (cytosine967-C5)-methyltransferase